LTGQPVDSSAVFYNSHGPVIVGDQDLEKERILQQIFEIFLLLLDN
jgi:hypothetical protein